MRFLLIMLRKLKNLGLMAVRLPYYAVKAHRLMLGRYLRREAVVGAIPYEVNLHDKYWEKRLKLDTGGWDPVELEDGMLYEATPYLVLQDILRHLDLGPEDVFVDLGCGKGRATCVAARESDCAVVGVEQDEGFLAVAQSNLNNLDHTRGEVHLHHGLAQDFDFDQATVVFLFNPFGAQTMEEVLELLHSSLDRNPRRLRIVYVNPVHEKVLAHHDWLQNTQTWPSDAYPGFEIQPPNPRLVTFWEAA